MYLFYQTFFGTTLLNTIKLQQPSLALLQENAAASTYVSRNDDFVCKIFSLPLFLLMYMSLYSSKLRD
jgi:hypothetical protein